MGRKKRRKKKHRLARAFNRVFESEYGAALLFLSIVCLGAFVFALSSGLWFIFGMFFAGGVLIVGGIFLFHKLLAPPVTSKPAGEPEAEPSSEPAVESWSFEEDPTPEPPMVGQNTNLPGQV